MWKRCVTALGHPEIAEDPRFLTSKDRIANQAELVRMVTAVTQQFETEELLERLRSSDVISSAILTVDQMLMTNRHSLLECT